MNLFIIGWNLPDEYQSRIVPEMEKMTEIYPRLDPKTLWHRRSTSGSLFTASMHTADLVAAPRQYVSENENQVILYSGLPINSTGTFAAHRSEELSSHWDQLTENLEGMFCIVRATDSPSRLELLNDIIGMEQIFYYHQDNLWLISNSVYLIGRIVRNLSLDPVGISLSLILGYVGSDRTLLSNVRVMPGGQYWTWKENDIEPSQQSYCKPSMFAQQPRKKLTSSYFRRLADDLSGNLLILSQNFDNITCALTGGRDSRLVATLLIHAKLKAQYYTIGDQSGTDAIIAQQIADTFNLNYKLIHLSGTEVIRSWDTTYRQLVLQSDGMGTIDLIPSILINQNLYSGSLCIDLGGTGGEVAHGGLVRTPEFKLIFGRHDIASMQSYLFNKTVNDYGGFIRQAGIEMGREFIHRFVIQYLNEGFAPVDIPNVFYLYSRTRRKRGNNKRVQMQYQDFYTPFISRAYIRAAFAISVLKRFSDPVHYKIIRLLLPKLHSIPLDKTPWPYQNSFMNLFYTYYNEKILNRVRNRISNTLTFGRKLQPGSVGTHYASDMFDQTSWFKAKRKQIREFCLDQNDSLIWNFVDRSVFEKISSLSSDPTEVSQYGAYITIFFRIATLFYYESSIKDRSRFMQH